MYGSIRLDHIVIYGSLVIISFIAILSKIRFLKLSKVLLYLYIFLFLIIFFSSLFNQKWTEFSFVLATFENYFQTIAIIIIFSVLLSGQDVNLKSTIADYSNEPSSQSVKARSMTLGRFLGVFNQPIASGSAYLTGFICWLYLSIEFKGLIFKKIVSLTLILIGGAASISKVIILGLPLITFIFLLGCLFINRLPKFPIFTFIVYFLLSPLIIFGTYLANWRGFDFFTRFFKYENYQGLTKTDNVIIATIEGRFEANSGTMLEFIKMIDTNLFFGFGVTEMRVFDSGFFEIILGTGLIGMFIYLSIIFYLLIMSIKSILKRDINGVLFFCLIITIIATSFGGQPFQLNRSSFIVIITILAFMTIVKKPKKNL